MKVQVLSPVLLLLQRLAATSRWSVPDAKKTTGDNIGVGLRLHRDASMVFSQPRGESHHGIAVESGRRQRGDQLHQRRVDVVHVETAELPVTEACDQAPWLIQRRAVDVGAIGK